MSKITEPGLESSEVREPAPYGEGEELQAAAKKGSSKKGGLFGKGDDASAEEDEGDAEGAGESEKEAPAPPASEPPPPPPPPAAAEPVAAEAAAEEEDDDSVKVGDRVWVRNRPYTVTRINLKGVATLTDPNAGTLDQPLESLTKG
jgi:hypothetical protein